MVLSCSSVRVACVNRRSVEDRNRRHCRIRKRYEAILGRYINSWKVCSRLSTGHPWLSLGDACSAQDEEDSV